MNHEKRRSEISFLKPPEMMDRHGDPNAKKYLNLSIPERNRYGLKRLKKSRFHEKTLGSQQTIKEPNNYQHRLWHRVRRFNQNNGPRKSK